MKIFKTSLFILALSALFCSGLSAQSDLEKGFANPPQSAKAFTWWHWMNGNVSKEGITADLEAMARVGVGGVQAFNISIMSPGPVGYASDEWYDITNHAIKEAERLGIEFDLHNCPGWSSTGGFWITPEQAGKQITWSQAYLKGGKKVDMILPQPRTELDSYWDEIVIAYPSPKNDAIVDNYLVKAAVDGVQINPSELLMNAHKEIRFNKEVVLEFSEAVRAQTFNSFIKNDMPPVPEDQRRQMQQGFASAPTGVAPTLSFSMDGENWSEPKNISILMEAVSYLSFPETEFRFAKIEAKQTVILEGLQFSGAPMNTNFLRNANYAMRASGGPGGFGGPFGRNIALSAPKMIPLEYTIKPESVIDISEYMDESGRLIWDAPEGEWTVIRMGYIPIDRHTKMGSTIGDGLEIDKYSKEALKFHWDYLFPRLIPALESAAKNVKAGMLIDSYEAGNLNWTPLMREEFKQRRNYDMTGYLPALVGKYVASEDVTERFMWDFRRTCADLFADNYLGYMSELCHNHGILLYNEPYNSSVFDEMQAGSRADIPMGEFWVRTHQDRSAIKMAGSIAHVNAKRIDGNQIVGAESYTGWHPDAAYQNFPYSLKAQGDDVYTVGLNRFIFHRFAHQPNVHANPGMSMGNIGFHFDRNNTWFEMGSKWLEYVARCQYMLQQGNIVADALYLVSENVPGSSRGAWNPDIPFGYFGDQLNAEMFLNAVKVDGDALVNEDGVRYRLLMIQNEQNKSMTIEVLRKIDEFVSAGGAVCGLAPVRTPNLSSDVEIREFKSLVEKLWGGIQNGGSKNVGKGRVFATLDAGSVMKALGIVPDLELSFAEDAPINFIHRTLGDTDIYFLVNHRRSAESVVATFRSNGKQPELWNADSGEIIDVNVYDVLPDGRVRFTLQFDPVGSWFVIFRDKANDKRFVSVKSEGKQILGAETYTERKGGLYADIHNNFSISVWIRPESNSSIPGGRRGAMWGSSANSYPYPLGNAEELYGAGHAVAGIIATRAGVSVMERSAAQAQAVVVSQDKLSSWNHIVVVYENGAPSLYVNGELKQKGQASGKCVHPSYKDMPISANNLAFEGDFADYQVIGRSISAEEVKARYAQGEPDDIAPVEKVKYTADGKLLYFANGDYKVKTLESEQTVKIKNIPEPKDLTAAGWTVHFPADLGAPESIKMPSLLPLQKHNIDGVKYFSGTATYKTSFKMNKSEIKGKKLFLDLGRVYVIANVKLNGKDLGVVWKSPYMIEITDALIAGENILEISVANLWTNRLIGDAQTPDAYEYGQGDSGVLPEWYLKNQPKPEDGKVAFSVVKLFEADEPLYDSGLVGPVVIRTAVVDF